MATLSIISARITTPLLLLLVSVPSYSRDCFCSGWLVSSPKNVLHYCRAKSSSSSCSPLFRRWSSLRQNKMSEDSSSSSSMTIKEHLFQLLQSTPSNEPTPPSLTKKILDEIGTLEKKQQASEEDAAQFLSSLAGNWELLWTTQDVNSEEYRNNNPMLRWINPLENQSYSNNPSGRRNPILPRNIQDTLEDLGIVSSDNSSPRQVSTQSIDVGKQRVRNVVRFFTLGKQGTLTVDVAFLPNTNDFRRIDVKFEQFRLIWFGLDITFPLGRIGPTGWLRTTFLDDDIRITRGHKGSVFLLSRTNKNKKSKTTATST